MTSPAVVDASVAVKWFVPESRSDDAEALATYGPRLIGPTLIRMEVASAFSKKMRSGLVTLDHAVEYLALLPRYFDELVDLQELMPAALAMAHEIDHPVYDCIYVETARRRDGVLVTDDQRLIRKLQRSAWARFAVALSEWRTLAR